MRTKDGHEIDFCVCVDDKPVLAVEVKQSDVEPARAFRVFQGILQGVRKVQLVANLKRDFSTPDGIEVMSLPHFLRDLDLVSALPVSGV